MYHSCAIIGHRPTRFKFKYKENCQSCIRLKMQLQKELIHLYERGVCRFLVDGGVGVGQWAGEILLRLKEQAGYRDIALVIVSPYPSHDANWDERSKARLAFLIQHSSGYIITGTHAGRESYVRRNKYLVDHADCLLAIFDRNLSVVSDTERSMIYAKKRHLPFILIDPNTAATLYCKND